MIGLVVLGHTPRPDHEEVYEAVAPGVSRCIAGGLDGLSPEQARKLHDVSGVSPLVCLLSDKTTVEIPLPVLFPYLKEKVEQLAAKGASSAVVLCSGGFPEFNCSIPVILPGLVVPSVVASLYPGKKIGLVVPNAAQVPAARAHWKSMGVETTPVVVSPYQEEGFEEAGALFATLGPDLVAIDCMGFTEEHRVRLKGLCRCPVLLPKTLVARVALELHLAAVRQVI
jgi:protein AroM